MATRHDGMGRDTGMARHYFRGGNITPTPRTLADLRQLRGDLGIRSCRTQFASFLHSMLDVKGAENDAVLPDDPDRPGQGHGDQSVHSSLPNLTLCSDAGPGCQAGVPRHRPGPGVCQSGAGRLTGAGGRGPHMARAGTVSRHPERGPVRAGSPSDRGDQRLYRIEDVTSSLQPPVTRPGLCYRSSVRVMVRDTEPSVRSGPRPGGDKVPIVRPAMRLPRDLYDKMPSAPSTPGASRRETGPSVSKLACTSPQPAKRVPKSVASMVRR